MSKRIPLDGWQHFRSPLVSVIIPIYNVERYLVECLDSIEAKTYSEIEILAIDDGSTDGSFSVLKSYTLKHSNVRVFCQENSGAGVARNRGIDEARGKYILFVDPDDAIELNTIATMVSIAEEKKTDIILTCLARYDCELKTLLKTENHPPQADRMPDVFSGAEIAPVVFTTFKNGPSPCNKFFRRQFILDHGLRFQALPRVNDLSFSYAALAFAGRVHVDNRAYYKYRTGRKGSSQNTTDKDPTPVCSAYHRLKEILSEAGVFDSFAKSFYLAFYGSCSYTFKQLKNIGTAERLIEVMKSAELADIAGCRLSRNDFRLESHFRAYEDFWRLRNPVTLMIDATTRARLNNPVPVAKGVPAHTLGIICGGLMPGGIERVLVYLIPMFVSQGYKVVLMTSRPESPGEYLLPEGCERVVIGRPCAGDDGRYTRIKLTLIRYGIDTVIDHEYYLLTIGEEIDAIHSVGARVVLHHHSVFSNMYLRENRQLALPQLLQAYRKCEMLIALSDIDAYFFALMGCRVQRITDPVPFVQPMKREIDPLRPIVLWVARFVDGKRPLDAVKIIEKVREKLPDARLVMLGDGDVKQVTAVRTYLDQHPELEGGVSLEGYQHDVFAYAKKADVFLTTTKFDGFSLSILEAKAAGLPVVTYAMPYLETVRSGTGAVSVPQGDVGAAAAAILNVLLDHELSKELSIQARASYEEFAHYDQWKQYQVLLSNLDRPTSGLEVAPVERQMRIILDTLFEHISYGFNELQGSTEGLTGTDKKTFALGKQVLTSTVRQLRTWRVDLIYNERSAGEFLLRKQSAGISISAPAWMKKDGRSGCSIVCTEPKGVVAFHCKSRGTITIALRGSFSKALDGWEIIPFGADYVSVMVNGKNAIVKPQLAWLNEPYLLNVEVKSGEMVEIAVETVPHVYERAVLRDMLLKAKLPVVVNAGNVDAILDSPEMRPYVFDSLRFARQVVSRLVSWRIDCRYARKDVAALVVTKYGEETSGESPAWIKSADLDGLCIVGSGLKGAVSFKAQGSGAIQLNLMGPVVLDKTGKTRLPVYVTYTSVKVGGRELLPGKVFVWHGKPYKLLANVKTGELIELAVTTEPYVYTHAALKDLLLRAKWPVSVDDKVADAILEDPAMRMFLPDVQAAEIAAQRKRLAELEKKLAQAQQATQREKRKAEAKAKEVAALKASEAYRIGMAVTSPVRSLKRALSPHK